MRLVKYVLLGLLAVYTAAIIGIEATSSQEHVRYYLTDIYGPVFLYAINTTISNTLLWCSGLLFVVSLMCLDHGRSGKRKYFYLSQAAIFVYLGFDERLMLHECAGIAVGIDDAFVLAAIAVVEGGVLLGLGELRTRSKAVISYLAAAVFFSAVMLVFDGFVPRPAPLRLSFEDLSKIWGDVFLFLFAFEILREEIAALKARALSAGIQL